MTVIALKQGNDAKALEYARKGYDLDNSDPVIVANLGVAYHYNGMFELRDKMTKEAEKLGYKKGDGLRKLYAGEATVRD
jgi:Flp pilus assembly protein TadD